MAEPLLHERYLPFTKEDLSEHFATVNGKPQDGRHLRYFTESLKRNADYLEAEAKGKPTPSEIRHGRQLEKDERFWVVSALMRMYHRPGEAGSAQVFAQLLNRADLGPPEGFAEWASALEGKLKLYFEVNLPSPKGYGTWLRNHLDERVLIPYVQEAASRAATKGARVEGATKADAMLLAPDTGVAVIFEAKVLADVSTHVTFDVARNQLARNIDVMLEPASGTDPLSQRRPDRTAFVLLTPDLFRRSATGLRGSRLYGWLMDSYRRPGDGLLAEHLGHRRPDELVGVANRLGWGSWEDVNQVVPGACPWLTA